MGSTGATRTRTASRRPLIRNTTPRNCPQLSGIPLLSPTTISLLYKTIFITYLIFNIILEKQRKIAWSINLTERFADFPLIIILFVYFFFSVFLFLFTFAS